MSTVPLRFGEFAQYAGAPFRICTPLGFRPTGSSS
jgi:hypothetical protein